MKPSERIKQLTDSISRHLMSATFIDEDYVRMLSRFQAIEAYLDEQAELLKNGGE